MDQICNEKVRKKTSCFSAGMYKNCLAMLLLLGHLEKMIVSCPVGGPNDGQLGDRKCLFSMYRNVDRILKKEKIFEI